MLHTASFLTRCIAQACHNPISTLVMHWYWAQGPYKDSTHPLQHWLCAACSLSQCPRNDIQSRKGEVASSDATVLLCAQEDSETDYEEDFDVLSDEMELEYSGKACLSFSSDDDSAESLVSSWSDLLREPQNPMITWQVTLGNGRHVLHSHYRGTYILFWILEIAVIRFSP